MDDHDFDEELRERDEEYAERIEHEILRMQEEESERLAAEAEAYGVEAESESGEEGEEEPSQIGIISLFFTGNILIKKSLSRHYGRMVIVAMLLLVSIVVMFWSLHLDMRYNTLSREVQLLRERSVRLQQERFERCAHSSIVDELERRDISLVDPTSPAIIIDHSSFWSRLMR